jgi:hypothetical protein
MCYICSFPDFITHLRHIMAQMGDEVRGRSNLVTDKTNIQIKDLLLATRNKVPPEGRA